MNNPGAPADISQIKAFYDGSITRHLRELGDWAVGQLYQAVREKGHGGVRRIHEMVLVPMSLNGSRLVDVARKTGVTKNTIGQLADELEALNYIRREDDPLDGRAKLLKYTESGIALLRDAMEAGEAIEVELAQLLGQKKADLLKQLLAEAVTKLRETTEDG